MKRIFLLASLIVSLACSSTYAQNNAQINHVTKPTHRLTDWHQKAQTKFINVDGTRYAYRVLGNKSGIPVVMLQGSFFNMDEWDPKVTNGLAQSFKVIIFDNKGQGATNGKTPNNIPDMARDAVSFIKALGYPKVNLLGFSMGGYMTQEILLTEPQLVNKVILASTGPKGAEGLSDLPTRLGEVSKKTPDDQLLSLLFTQSDYSQDAGKSFLERIHQRTVDRDLETTNESNGQQVAAVLDWAQPKDGTFDQLKTITHPVLIFEGHYDRLVPVVNSFNLYQNIPNARLVLFPDAAHGAIFQYTDLFLAEAVPFLKQ
jgi:pimeloyl-ACP methyl ester carboxylesterase